jgi:site-specific DNA-methyltransferase (adenine-specific)
VKPYFVDGNVTLYLGDCREVLSNLDLDHVGVVITDPPYGETSLAWDRWQAGWVDAVASAVRTSCSLWCFGSMRMLLNHVHEFARWRLAQDLVWEKHRGSSMATDRFRRVHEHITHWYRGPWRDIHHDPPRTRATAAQIARNGSAVRTGQPRHTGTYGAPSQWTETGTRLMQSVIRVKSCRGYALHPTQKPLGIIDPLLRYSLAPGGTVLDPFAGAGSTLVAAREAGFRAIGIEADEVYAEVAAKRLSQGTLGFEEPDTEETASA